ncbi:peroxisomal biogenesis factor 19 [Anopheles arabiensis]|uniref:Peroxin-19 n=1 Tax=Anopheles arabiensis TaxID=7173 RepID=A0A182IB35_ANOAR|nr:peroxisomal biogenesis factor 19 [Anopheles arabiensis]XP_040163530.1 peroxisomal biogenesis factor 19 [Anopheles arabiensis]XP_040163531.1 peroxisomal biogenesis factor 19 [Anopheles arabiensis]
MAESKKPTEDGSRDKELDDLLDSALEDFSKHKADPKKPAKSEGGGASSSGEQTVQHEDPPTEQLWNEEFMDQQAKMFEQHMAALFGGGEKVDSEQIMLGFQRIAEAAGMAVRAEGPAAPDAEPSPANTLDPTISQSISDALKAMSEGRENLQTPFSPEDVANMFGNIDLNASGENNAFLPFMQNMMQSLLSADVLLPSMRDLVGKYPQWLAEHSATLPKEEKERYEKQLALMQEVCTELEKETPDDSAEVKKERFQIVLEKMQSMQDLGQPPADLVGDLGGPGNLNLPTLDPSSFSEQNPCPIS